eukprot:TRINITY_DN8888_c0_g1_i1.p1 TRINITY_DN8888_c0_g1~~TRINITY_DN8888_c0_g1_i1.p1  ORF type:complete len:585 (+),score=119.66 TRINITY_DN8888_c0_g1_i1:54-1757(+)
MGTAKRDIQRFEDAPEANRDRLVWVESAAERSFAFRSCMDVMKQFSSVTRLGDVGEAWEEVRNSSQPVDVVIIDKNIHGAAWATETLKAWSSTIIVKTIDVNDVFQWQGWRGTQPPIGILQTSGIDVKGSHPNGKVVVVDPRNYSSHWGTFEGSHLHAPPDADYYPTLGNLPDILKDLYPETVPKANIHITSCDESRKKSYSILEIDRSVASLYAHGKDTGIVIRLAATRTVVHTVYKGKLLGNPFTRDTLGMREMFCELGHGRRGLDTKLAQLKTKLHVKDAKTIAALEKKIEEKEKFDPFTRSSGACYDSDDAEEFSSKESDTFWNWLGHETDETNRENEKLWAIPEAAWFGSKIFEKAHFLRWMRLRRSTKSSLNILDVVMTAIHEPEIPDDVRPLLLETVLLDGCGGMVEGVVSRIESGLFGGPRFKDHHQWTHRGVPLDEVTCKLLDKAREKGKPFVDHGMTRYELSDSSIACGEQVDPHPIQPSAGWHGLPPDTVRIIMSFLPPFSRYNTQHAVIHSSNTVTQAYQGVRKLLSFHTGRSICGIDKNLSRKDVYDALMDERV